MKYLKIIILIVVLIIGAVVVYMSMSPPKSPLDSASFKNELHDLERHDKYLEIWILQFYFLEKYNLKTFNKVLNISIDGIFDLPCILTSNIIGISIILKPSFFI